MDRAYATAIIESYCLQKPRTRRSSNQRFGGTAFATRSENDGERMNAATLELDTGLEGT